MQTEPDPSPPSTAEAESAVGLAFVAIVLVSLFAAGTLGVLATRESGQSADPAQEPEVAAVAGSTSTVAMQVRNRIVSRSPARLVTGSGRQVRATRASAAVYRCTLVKRDGSWRVLRFARSSP